VVNTLAYVADYDAGLHVLDVSDPTKIRRLGGFKTSGYALRVHVAGTRVCVATAKGGGSARRARPGQPSETMQLPHPHLGLRRAIGGRPRLRGDWSGRFADHTTQGRLGRISSATLIRCSGALVPMKPKSAMRSFSQAPLLTAPTGVRRRLMTAQTMNIPILHPMHVASCAHARLVGATTVRRRPRGRVPKPGDCRQPGRPSRHPAGWSLLPLCHRRGER